MYRTTIIPDSSKPVWNFTSTLNCFSSGDVLWLRVIDHEPNGMESLIGEAELLLAPYFNKGNMDVWVELYRRKQGFLSSVVKRYSRGVGEVHLIVNFSGASPSPYQSTGQTPQQSTTVPSSNVPQTQMVTPQSTGVASTLPNVSPQSNVTATPISNPTMTNPTPISNLTTLPINPNLSTQVAPTSSVRFGQPIETTVPPRVI